MNKIDVSRIHVSMETVKPYNQGGKKEEVTMESAMSNNEKIRDWVSQFEL